MASVTVTLSGLPKDQNAIGSLRDTPREVVKNLDALLWQVVQGAMLNANPKIFVSYSANDAVYAYATLTISGGSGSVGGTIDGTAKTVTWATSDANSAALLAAAVNADATISKKVLATAAGNVVTLTALVPGAIGNKYTLVASGTGVTASGANFANGAGADSPAALTSNNF